MKISDLPRPFHFAGPIPNGKVDAALVVDPSGLYRSPLPIPPAFTLTLFSRLPLPLPPAHAPAPAPAPGPAPHPHPTPALIDDPSNFNHHDEEEGPSSPLSDPPTSPQPTSTPNDIDTPLVTDVDVDTFVTDTQYSDSQSQSQYSIQPIPILAGESIALTLPVSSPPDPIDQDSLYQPPTTPAFTTLSAASYTLRRSSRLSSSGAAAAAAVTSAPPSPSRPATRATAPLLLTPSRRRKRTSSERTQPSSHLVDDNDDENDGHQHDPTNPESTPPRAKRQATFAAIMAGPPSQRRAPPPAAPPLSRSSSFQSSQDMDMDMDDDMAPKPKLKPLPKGKAKPKTSSQLTLQVDDEIDNDNDTLDPWALAPSTPRTRPAAHKPRQSAPSSTAAAAAGAAAAAAPPARRRSALGDVTAAARNLDNLRPPPPSRSARRSAPTPRTPVRRTPPSATAATSTSASGSASRPRRSTGAYSKLAGMAKVLNNKQAKEFVTDDAFFKAMGGCASVTADYILSLSGFRSVERTQLKPLLDAFMRVARSQGKSVAVLADDANDDDKVHLVTHVIAKADENLCVVKRTHKYIAACVYGRWVLDVDWLRTCRAQKAIVPEDTFELYGDCVSGQSLGTRRNRERVESESPSPLAAHSLYFCPTTGTMGRFLAHHLPWLQVNTYRLAYTRAPASPATVAAVPSSDLLAPDSDDFAPPSSFDPDTHALTGLPGLSRATRATKAGYTLVALPHADNVQPKVAVHVDPRRPIVVVRGATGAPAAPGGEPTWTDADTRRIEALKGWQVVPLGVVLRCVTESRAVGEVGVAVGGAEERVVRCALGEGWVEVGE